MDGKSAEEMNLELEQRQLRVAAQQQQLKKRSPERHCCARKSLTMLSSRLFF